VRWVWSTLWSRQNLAGSERRENRLFWFARQAIEADETDWTAVAVCLAETRRKERLGHWSGCAGSTLGVPGASASRVIFVPNAFAAG